MNFKRLDDVIEKKLHKRIDQNKILCIIVQLQFYLVDN